MAKFKEDDFNDIFTCDDINPFIKTIVNILAYKGYSSSTFFDNSYKGFNFMTKLTFSGKTPKKLNVMEEGDDKNVQQDTENQIYDLFAKEFLDKDVTPCIARKIFSKKCFNVEKIVLPPEECVKLSLKGSSNDNFTDILNEIVCTNYYLIKNKIFNNCYHFTVLEKYDLTLNKFLYNSNIFGISVEFEIFKTIIFQILFTMYKITEKYNDFLHGDFHGENILLEYDREHKFDPSNMKYIQFKIEGDEYNMPYYGITPKIIDFAFSKIPSIGIVSEVWDSPPFDRLRPLPDLIQLFSDLYQILRDHKHVIDMFKQFMPTESYKRESIYYIEEVPLEIIPLKEMFSAEIFSNYKKKYDDSMIIKKY